MTEEIDFETYLTISKNKLQISLFDKKKFKDIYNDELQIKNEINFIDFIQLSKFLDDNIFKIEKLAGIFIKNIFLIIESDKIFYVNMSVKKKNYDNLINKKYLENTLIDLKDLFKENYKDQNIMHMIINNYLINEKNYPSFVGNLNSDYFCIEVSFISISNDMLLGFVKVLEKYQIKISQYLDGNYIKNFPNKSEMELSKMAHKIRNGYNDNEVILIPKNTENKGFFEKFFQLFS